MNAAMSLELSTENQRIEMDQEFIVRHSVVLRKDSKRSLTTDKIVEQIRLLVAKVESPGRVSKGWSAVAAEPVIETVEQEGPKRARGNAPTSYINRVTLALVCSPDRPRPSIAGEFQNIVSLLVASSNSFPNWQVETVDDEQWADASAADIKAEGATDYVGYAPVNLPGNWQDYFSHLYERDAQVTVVMSALEAALESDWANRFHVVLMGPPACGKTELLSTLRRMLGSDAVLALDCTATTQAGLTKDLAEREELPRVIIAEELEKAEEGALRVLLGLLDTRGEIRKVTAREKITRDCKVLMFATVNDVSRFESLLSGALASRFAHQVFCPRPQRSLMAQILHREVRKINGNPVWVEPTLDYLESIRSSDPRKGIALCLSGRDGWISGSYPEMLRQIRQIGEEDKK